MSTAMLDSRELAALLEWYVENGVDLALDDAPHERYADSVRAPQAEAVREAPAPRTAPERSTAAPRVERPQSTSASRREIAPVAPDEAARAAAATAADARDLAELAERLAAFDHAPFRDMARHFLFAAGAESAPLMVFDVAPGETEESNGEPFCGQQATLLDNMLAAIRFDRSRARLAYLSPWRPPGGTSLAPQHIAIFAPFACRQIELSRPDVLLLFGEPLARALLQTNEPLARMRGRVFDLSCGAHQAQAFVFPSLDTILRSATFKPGVWRDLRAASALLSGQ